MKKLILILALSITLSGCQQNLDKGEAERQPGKEKDAVVVSSSKNTLSEVNVFGGNTFDPELQIEVKDDGFFDSNTDLSIIEEGENLFVLWKSGDGFLMNPDLMALLLQMENGLLPIKTYIPIKITPFGNKPVHIY
jgi:hypothetical protein